MKHIKQFEKIKNDTILEYYGWIKIGKLKTIIATVKEMKLEYSLYEVTDDTNNNHSYNVVIIVNATTSQVKVLHKKISLVYNNQIIIHILSNYKNITNLTEDEIIENYNTYKDSKKYNL